MAKSQDDNCKDKCIQRCRGEGYSLAGMQFGNECFCGERSLSDLKKHKLEEQRCDKKCPGDESETCGGYLTMNVYHTGSIPNKPGLSVLPETGAKINIYTVIINQNNILSKRINSIYYANFLCFFR